MPGNPSLNSPEGIATLFLIGGLALLGAIIRVCLKPGKTPRDSLKNFGGCMGFGTLIGIGFRNSSSVWVQNLFELIVGFAAMLGPEFFTVCLQTLPRAVMTFIRLVALQISRDNEPTDNA